MDSSSSHIAAVGSRSSAPSTDALTVVSGADEAYALPLAVMLTSLLQHAPANRPLHLCLLDSGFLPETRARLTDLVARHGPDVDLTWVALDASQFAHLQLAHRDYISTAAYARLRIPDVLPDADWALYLDADLVVNEDVTALWDADLQGQPIAAVQDAGVPVAGAKYGIRSHADLGIPPDAPYFNSGVLVMDLAQWRRDGIADDVLDYLNAYRDVLNMCDQEGLNAVLHGCWASLGLRWNVTTEFFEVDRKIPDAPRYDAFRRRVRDERAQVQAAPAIVHYTSQSKPWHGDADHPHRALFLRYLRASGWLRGVDAWTWWARYGGTRAWWLARTRTRRYRMRIPGLHRG